MPVKVVMLWGCLSNAGLSCLSRKKKDNPPNDDWSNAARKSDTPPGRFYQEKKECANQLLFFAVSHGDRPGGHQDIRQLSAPQAVHEVHWSVTQILTFLGGFFGGRVARGFCFHFPRKSIRSPIFIFIFLSCYLFSFS